MAINKPAEDWTLEERQSEIERLAKEVVEYLATHSYSEEPSQELIEADNRLGAIVFHSEDIFLPVGDVTLRIAAEPERGKLNCEILRYTSAQQIAKETHGCTALPL